GDVAAERGAPTLDTFLDIALADELRTRFATPKGGDDDESWQRRLQLWRDPRTLIGASDAAAPLDMLATVAFFTNFVGPSVRDRGLLPLEEAVHLVTDAPARFYGLVDRGRIAEGYRADITMFDASAVATGEVVMRDDMPGDASRLYAEAEGV